MQWKTSTYSAGGANCVEIACSGSSVLMRDTKDRSRGHFGVGAQAWRAFIGHAGRMA